MRQIEKASLNKNLSPILKIKSTNLPAIIDEKTLSEIAKVTGGQYFRATDTESLRQIYKEIDSMEKVRIEEKGYVEYTQLFGYVLLAALILLLVEILLSRTVLLKIP